MDDPDRGGRASGVWTSVVKILTFGSETLFANQHLLFLGVSWITNNYAGSKHVNDLFMQPYTPNRTHLRWNRFKKGVPWAEFLWYLVGWRPPQRTNRRIFLLLDQIRVPPWWIMIFDVAWITNNLDLAILWIIFNT